MLEGNVRKAGNRVRVTAQLINVDDGYHLWSERFDRELDPDYAPACAGLSMWHLMYGVNVVSARELVPIREWAERALALDSESSEAHQALVHFGLGDVERCLDRLEEVVDEKPALVPVTAWLHVDPFWDSLRDHPRFQTVVGRMNFPN